MLWDGLGDQAVGALLDALSDLVVIAEADGVVWHVNRAATRTTGWSLEEARGSLFWELFAEPSSRRAARAAWRQRGTWEGELFTRDGQRRLVSWTFGGEGCIFATGVDVTDRRQVEDALRASEAHLDRVAANVPGVLFQLVLDGDGRLGFTYVSDGATEVLEIAPEVLRHDAHALIDRIVSRDRARFESRLARSARKLSPLRWEGRVKLPSGRTRWLQAESRPVCRDGAIHWDGLLVDITERRALQERLALNDRMISVGQIAAGVAHEINNPLSYVLGHLELLAADLRKLQDDLPEGTWQRLDQKVAAALHGSQRVQRIVQDLKVFSRVEHSEAGPVDLHRALESAAHMANNEIRHRARYIAELGSIPAVHGEESRLAQVLLNLLINAAHAIPEGAADRHQITVRTGVTPDGRIFCEIEDTGCGMDRETLARIFDPFFTTKPVGIGTGLGLPICQTIVSELGGEITVRSEPGQGSCFRVLLLAAAEPALVEEEPTAVEEPVAGIRARILVVDDEPDIIWILERTFDDHDVTVAESGREALQLLRERGPFDLVLCDLMMPEVTGMDLYEELRASAPGQEERLVFMTGGAFTARGREFLQKVPNRWIEKPFELQHLRALVHDLLAEPTEEVETA